ncbi:Molecular co-chaperone STI1 [Ceraceosorus bombacis]|uniref:Molecular co-chaperone STI1 n=1 Tax=Ceraceosorus bombacis TaxID=401625 RepID=A0A0P1BQC5_9BASI|nr:Molecular co-chaperone STI1 [Ceraceosorus bombacis]
MSAAELKAQGNAAFAKKDYAAAIQHYTSAIDVSPADSVHILYSNRSACHSGLRQWDKALQDAEATIKADPSFAKGYLRKGGALHGAELYDESIHAYEEGLQINPQDAALQRGLEDVKRAKDSSRGDPGAGLDNMFKDPKLFEKLEANESTKRMLADPSFVSKLKEMQSGRGSPQDAFSDSRMVEVMGVLMGIDLKAFQRPEGSNEGPEELQRRRDREEAEQEAQRENEKRRATKAAQDKKIAEEEAAAAPIDSEQAKAKKAADEAKARGSALYLKRQFDDAIAEFKQAWELHKDVSYLTNLAACQYEKASYDEAIATCQEAIEASREYKTDYKLIAKAYTRIGNSYLKKEDLQNAIKFFEKSLTEHRTADTLAKLQSTEKLLKEKEKQAYIDPSKAEEERARGNELFKKGDFAGSVAAYTESIKRNPSDSRGYTNRASSYLRLMAFPEALKDGDSALSLEPNSVKAHLRKASAQLGMKQYNKALEEVSKASEFDQGEGGARKHEREINELESKISRAIYEQRANETEEETLARAQNDPEVQSILQDPVMRSVLDQAQSNPAALQEHMRNPNIARKIQTLVNAGIIKMGRR